MEVLGWLGEGSRCNLASLGCYDSSRGSIYLAKFGVPGLMLPEKTLEGLKYQI